MRLLDTTLRSAHLPCKVCALFGALYLLEAGAADVAQQVVGLVVDCVLKQLSSITP